MRRSPTSIPPARHQHVGMAVHHSAQPLPFGIPQAPARVEDADGSYAETLKSQPEQGSRWNSTNFALHSTSSARSA